MPNAATEPRSCYLTIPARVGKAVVCSSSTSLDGRGAARVAAALGRQHGAERLWVVPPTLWDGRAGALVHEPPPVRRFLLEGVTEPLAEI